MYCINTNVLILFFSMYYWLFSTNIRFFFIKPSFPWLTVMVKKQLNILTSVAHTMTKILYIFKFKFKYKPPVVTHSPLCALDTFPNTAMCTQSHKRLSNICMFTCSCTTNHLVLFPSQLLDSQCFSLHMYSIYVKHSHSLYFLSLSLVVYGKHLYIVYLVNICQ